MPAHVQGTNACARSKSDGVDAININNSKSFDGKTGARAGLAVMTKINLKSE